MRRRTILQAAALLLTPGAAWAQAAPGIGTGPPITTNPQRAPAALQTHTIQPENPLEQAFLAAFEREAARTSFRRTLVTSTVALALADATPESAPRYVEAPRESGPALHAGAIYTSPVRLQAVFGANAPYVAVTGRQALERLRGRNAVLNFGLIPMLTLEAEDIARYLT